MIEFKTIKFKTLFVIALSLVLITALPVKQNCLSSVLKCSFSIESSVIIDKFSGSYNGSCQIAAKPEAIARIIFDPAHLEKVMSSSCKMTIKSQSENQNIIEYGCDSMWGIFSNTYRRDKTENPFTISFEMIDFKSGGINVNPDRVWGKYVIIESQGGALVSYEYHFGLNSAAWLAKPYAWLIKRESDDFLNTLACYIKKQV